MYLQWQKGISIKLKTILLVSLRSLTKIAGSGSVSRRYRSEDPHPDPYQNVTDPEHWLRMDLEPFFSFWNFFHYLSRKIYSNLKSKFCLGFLAFQFHMQRRKRILRTWLVFLIFWPRYLFMWLAGFRGRSPTASPSHSRKSWSFTLSSLPRCRFTIPHFSLPNVSFVL